MVGPTGTRPSDLPGTIPGKKQAAETVALTLDEIESGLGGFDEPGPSPGSGPSVTETQVTPGTPENLLLEIKKLFTKKT